MRTRKKATILAILAVLVLSLTVSVQPALACEYGCTPGFWKQSQHFWAWTPYDPNDLVVDVFSGAGTYVGAKDTLLDALRYRGGPGAKGAARIFLRAAVATLLNSAYDKANGEGWGWEDPADIVDRVNLVLSRNRDSMLREAQYFDDNNNEGCPLD